MRPSEHPASGQAAESLARGRLEEAGLETLACNWTCRMGEIDLIMKDGSEVVFVEVRYRAHEDSVGAVESIDRAKQRRLTRAALIWLQTQQPGDPPARFDVVTVDPDGVTEWLRDAFEAT